MLSQTESRRKFIINFVYWIIIFGLVYIGFKYALPLLMPFCLALLCSMILRPLIKFFHKKCHIGSSISAVISLFLFFVVVLGLLFVIVLRVVKGSVDFVSLLPGLYTNTVEPSLRVFLGNLENFADRFDPSVQAFVDKVTPEIISAVGSAVSKLATSMVSWVSGIAAKVPSILISCAMFFIGTIFITLSYDNIIRFLKRQFSEKTLSILSSVKKHLFTVVFKYGKSYLLIMLITFVEIAAGLLIIGIDNAILLAVIIAVFDIFPIVGAGTILVPWAVVDLIIGKTSVGISLLILYAVEVTIRQIIEPKIVGQHVGLHPIVTLISMFIGTKLFGGIGLFGLPITMAILKNLNITGTLHFVKYDTPESAPDAAASPEEADPPEKDQSQEE